MNFLLWYYFGLARRRNLFCFFHHKWIKCQPTQAGEFVLLKEPKTLPQASQAEEFELLQSNHNQIRQRNLLPLSGYFCGCTIKPFQTICYLHPYHSCVYFLWWHLLLYYMIMLKRLESKVGSTSRITHFPVLLGSHHQTPSNHMLIASLPCKGVLLVVTKFVALLYDNVEEARV